MVGADISARSEPFGPSLEEPLLAQSFRLLLLMSIAHGVLTVSKSALRSKLSALKSWLKPAASRLGTVSTAAAALKSALKMHCIFVWAAKKQNLPEIHYDPLSSYFRLCFCRRCCRINGVSYARLCRRQRNLWCPRLSSASGERLSADHG